MKNITHSVVIFVFFISNGLAIAQQSEKKNTEIRDLRSNESGRTTNQFSTDPLSEQTPDFKVISSNTSYFEIEFYPQFFERQNINYNGESFSFVNFENGIETGFDSMGEPDIKSRLFSVILPSKLGNNISVVDFDVNQVNGVNISPIPNYRLKNPADRSLESLEMVYIKDPAAYSPNKFLPENIAGLENIGTVRELVMGSLVIYPIQYNPVSKVLKQYTRIRIRVTFGQQPVMINRKRSHAETELLKGLGLNSDQAINWMNPELLNFRAAPVTNSFLSTGDWYKIEIRENNIGDGKSDAMYRMTKTFLERSGMNLSNVDPRTIKMYGNGGNLLPEDINASRPQDLIEIPIYIEGENDGHFDPQDYVVFYGKSINNWTYNQVNQNYSHYVNPYSLSNSYWICLNTPGNGDRMILQPSENVSNPITPSSFTEKLFYEPEILNLINEGNVWLSERKSNGQSFTWNNTLTGLEANSDILYGIKPASRMFCGYSNHMEIKEEHSTMSSYFYTMGCVNPGYGDWIWTAPTSFTINASQKTNGEQSTFKATYFSNSPDAEGYLDWMEIQYKRRFNSVTGDFIRFDGPDVTGTIEYNVSPFSGNNIKVFDVTVHDDVRIIQPLSAPSGHVRFQKNQGPLSKFFVIGPGPNGYREPGSISQRVPNQNLRGGYTAGASFIIITHKDFLPAANRLKAKRESPGPGNPNYLKTHIFDVQTIYNEFSGGVLDAVAIRDFLKHCYDTWQVKPVYVCFFGDGSFDYKSLFGQFSCWVPAFEYSDSNINQVNGYTTDDFFVQLAGNDPRPDIAHGRITPRNLPEANGYMDKIDCYEDQAQNGYWKNKAVYVADDGKTSYGNDGSQHTDQCEVLAELYSPNSLDKKKIYLVTYPAVITSQGRRKPDVNKDIIKYWNEGCISLNYTGHGSPEVWAHEYVLEKDVAISQLNNTCKYPFVSVASCDFSKFDNPQNQSGGELFTMAPNKGAIGTISATRPVYGQLNSIFNNKFWEILYFNRDTLLLQTRFGKAAFQTKQDLFQPNDLKFLLISDPSSRIQIPRFRSRIDSISGLSNDTMRALSRIKIYGSIMNPDSTFWAGFNGKIFLKIFDVAKQITMTDEDGFYFIFKLPGGTIYSGTQKVVNGRWVVEFIVPKDISYLNRNGRLINYFYSSTADGSSLYENFIVGGINPGAAIDTTGPDIKLYLDTRNFRSGDVVNENFKLIGDLYDESGINTTGTIGHKIEAVVDGNENNKYDLTAFYNSDTSYKSGSLEYDFTSVSAGKHKLRLKAWDTYNNSSEAEIEFNVSASGVLQVTNVLNYPNPFKDNTAFTFQHSYPDLINVKIKIYTVAGRLIKEISQNSISDKFVMINWSGKDEDGETLGNGIYIYKLTVDAGNGNSVTATGKMAVLK